MQGDGAGEEAGSGVVRAAGLVAQAGAFGLDRGGAVRAVADDPAGKVGDGELQCLGEVFRQLAVPVMRYRRRSSRRVLMLSHISS